MCTTIQLPNAKQITYEARRIRQGWTPRLEAKRQRVGERHQRERGIGVAVAVTTHSSPETIHSRKADS
jgi:hypothetical protein